MAPGMPPGLEPPEKQTILIIEWAVEPLLKMKKIESEKTAELTQKKVSPEVFGITLPVVFSGR